MAATHDISTPARSKQWYDDDVVEVNASIRALLEKYAKIPSQEVVPYVNKIVSISLKDLRTLTCDFLMISSGSAVLKRIRTLALGITDF